MPVPESAASINLLISKTPVPAVSKAVVAPSRVSPASFGDRPSPIKIPISLSAYVPGHQSKPQRRQPIAQRPKSSMTQTSVQTSSKTAMKMCKVGGTQGMCVKNDLVQSLCIPLGFKVLKSTTWSFLIVKPWYVCLSVRH